MVTRCADAARLVILCSVAAFALTGDNASALKAVLVLAPTLAARLVAVDPVLDLVFALALCVEAVGGGFETYYSAIGGDTLPHVLLPLLSGPVLYVVLIRVGAVARPPVRPSPAQLVRAALVTLAAVLALGALWELVEWLADGAFGTNYSQGSADTVRDLFNDTLAAAASGTLVAAWLQRGRAAGRELIAR